MEITVSPNQQVNRYGVLDIETNGTDPGCCQVVAIGVGEYDADSATGESEVLVLGDFSGDERSLIRGAYDWLNSRGHQTLVTYNGRGFDMGFLSARIKKLEWEDTHPILECEKNHVDPFVQYREKAEATGVKFPNLEELLDYYSIPVHTTWWNGSELTNVRFGEELAAKYIFALEHGVWTRAEELERVIRDYAVGDIEATIALYETILGRRYVPQYPKPTA